jgi:hypothetical protein
VNRLLDLLSTDDAFRALFETIRAQRVKLKSTLNAIHGFVCPMALQAR